MTIRSAARGCFKPDPEVRRWRSIVDGKQRARLLSSGTRKGRPAAPDALAFAIRGRLVALLQEFDEGIAAMAGIAAALESTARLQPGLLDPDVPFPTASGGDQDSSSIRVTLEVSPNDPSLLNPLEGALAGVRGVQRVRAVSMAAQNVTVEVMLDAAPVPTESLAAFRDSLAEIPGLRRVVLTEFAGDHATFVLSAAPEDFDKSDDEPFSVVCAWCGRVLSPGGSHVSHGLCAECADRAVAQASNMRASVQRNGLQQLPTRRQSARLRRIRGGAARQRSTNRKRLKPAVRPGEAVDAERLLGALVTVHTIIDGVARREELPGAAAHELVGSLIPLQEAIDLIARMAVAPHATSRP
jgi:hypothetical protein